MYSTSLLFLLVWLIIHSTLSYYIQDQIVSLPGWYGSFPSPQYSGYLSFVDPAGSGATLYYHYWLSLAERAWRTAPLLYWSNGGPGCSSMEGTFFEGGPFVINLDGNLTSSLSLRTERWSRFANVLYFETPVGVGFSYRDDRNYTDNNDVNTAMRNLAAMQEFYVKFPELKDNKLYLSGESYAGVYIPMLASNILKAVQTNTWNGGELIGIAVGNGCTGNTGICSDKCNGMAYLIQMLTEYAYVSPDLKKEIQNNCLLDIDACIASTAPYPGPVSAECQDLFTKVTDVYYPAEDVSGAINPYGVQEVCLQNWCPGPSGFMARDHIGGNLVSRLKRVTRNKKSFKSLESSTYPYDFSSFQSFSPCMDSAQLSSYFNDVNVQKAIHVQPLDYCYALCNNPDGWDYTPDDIVLPTDIYPELIPYLKIVIYNGVMDTVVPYTDNYGWMKSMNFSIIDGTYWKTWYYTEQAHLTLQTGGYIVDYNITSEKITPHASFTFKAVMNSGHMVPTDTPQAAFELFASFVGESLPVPNTFEAAVPSTSSSSDSSGLSEGEAAGVAIVVIFCFFTAIGLTWYYGGIYRRSHPMSLSSH